MILRIADVLRLLSYRHVGIRTRHSTCWVNHLCRKWSWERGGGTEPTLDLEPQGRGRRTALPEAGSDDCAEFPGQRSLQVSQEEKTGASSNPQSLSLLLIWGLWGKGNNFQMQNWCNAPVSTAESFTPEPWWRWGSECRCHRWDRWPPSQSLHVSQ